MPNVGNMGGLRGWSVGQGGGGDPEFSDEAFAIEDDGDATRRLRFEVSAISPATTRTLTVTDTSGTLVVTDTADPVELRSTGDSATVHGTANLNLTSDTAIEMLSAGNVYIESGGGGTLSFSSVNKLTFDNQNGGAAVFDHETLTDTREYDLPDADGTVSIRVAVPATATSAGVPGMWASDASFLYACHAVDTWRRVAVAAW